MSGREHPGDPTVEAGGPSGGEVWLDEQQQRVWRQWLALSAQLPAALNRQLQSDSDLSLQDFDVLVHLTEVPLGRCRAGALALALQWERSRMSHHIKRMEARGLVEREECEDDRRGAFVQITPAGRAATAAAAPDHVALVRRLMFEGLSEAHLEAVGDFMTRTMDRLGVHQRVEGVPVPPPARPRSRGDREPVMGAVPFGQVHT